MVNKRLQFLLKVMPHLRRMLENMITLVNLKYLVCHSTTKRMSAIRIAVPKNPHIGSSTLNRLHKISTYNRRTNGDIGRTQGFSKHHHLRAHIESIGTKISAKAPKSANNLIIPQRYVVFI